jgi:hypothetical protein
MTLEQIFACHRKKKMQGNPLPKKSLQFGWDLQDAQKKHITMHLLVGSNREATSASSAYVDGRIAWPL